MTAELQTQLDAANAAAAADKARAEQAERRLQELEDQHKAARRTANVAFAEAQVQAGRVLPHAKDMLVTTLEALADAAPVDFSEGGTTKKVSPADWLKGQITAGKPLISFSEHAPGKVIPGDHVTEATSDQDFDKAVRARMAKDTCSYSEAASKLTAGFTS